MTRRPPDEHCGYCGSVLFPTELAARTLSAVFPPTADYVCVNCGHAYRWWGSPPKLVVVADLPAEAESGEDNEP
jgi:hypothetical protein